MLPDTNINTDAMTAVVAAFDDLSPDERAALLPKITPVPPVIVPANAITNTPVLPNLPTLEQALKAARKNAEAMPVPAWASDHILSAEHYAPKRPYYTLVNGTVSIFN